jgi:hypothetical protein
VLIWIDELHNDDIRALDELEILRDYLHTIDHCKVQIRLWVPTHHDKTVNTLGAVAVQFSPVIPIVADVALQEQLKGSGSELADAVSTARAVDADCIAINQNDWFPYIEEVQRLSILLTDCDFLLRYSEVFVRGHDIPWSFQHKICNAAWSTFYHFTEERTFRPGMELLNKAHHRGAPPDSMETG